MNAIITGVGRPSGIGAAIAYELAQRGYNLYLTSYKEYDVNHDICIENGRDIPDEYLAIKNRCETFGGKVVFESIDLTSPKACQSLFDDANSKLGDIQVLVTSHCLHEFDKFGEIEDSLLSENFRTNAESTFMLIQEFYRRFVGTVGSIVALSSTQGLDALVTEISYAVSKASIPVIVSTIAPIMAQKGIRINAVNPGSTDIGNSDDYTVGIYKCSNQFGRTGKPTDTANLVAFLVSNEGQWITGQTIHSEGSVFRGVTAFPSYENV